MSQHARFTIGLGLAFVVALLMGLLFLLPECAYEPTRETCVAAKQEGALVYGVAAVGLLVLSIGLHLKGWRVGSFLALVALMIVPFAAASLASR